MAADLQAAGEAERELRRITKGAVEVRAGLVGVHRGQIAQGEGAVEVAVLEDELAHTVSKAPHRVAQLCQRHLPQVPALQTATIMV